MLSVNSVMALLEKTQSFIFNSEAKSGAQSVSADGSVFSITLNSPIKIPKDALDCTVGVLQSAIWNTSYNIAAGFFNNNFRFTTTAAHTLLLFPTACIVLRGLTPSCQVNL